jgi:hypothetical protein
MEREEDFKIKLGEELFKEFETRVLPLLESISDETKRFLLFTAWLKTSLSLVALEESLSQADSRLKYILVEYIERWM